MEESLDLRFLELVTMTTIVSSISTALSVFPEKRLFGEDCGLISRTAAGNRAYTMKETKIRKWILQRGIFEWCEPARALRVGHRRKFDRCTFFRIPAQRNAGIMNPKTPYLDLVCLIPWERGFFRCQVR